MKCPYCDTVVNSVRAEDVTAHVHGQPQWRCLGYSCMKCQKVLSIQMHPLALEDDLVQRLAKELRKP